jgi:hypothetical protein
MTPLPDIVAEADRILTVARSEDVPLRLIGGLAIRRQVGADVPAALQRSYQDVDLATPKGRGRAVAELMAGIGYQADTEFNTLQGTRRMVFHDLANQRKVDLFVGAFELCHTIAITDRIDVDPDTIPLAELLLTKLQVVELNDKDLRDLIALLVSMPIGHLDDREINGDRIASLLAADWGLWRTTKMNLDRIRESLEQYDLEPGERDLVRARCDELWARIEAEPKSRGWLLRNRIGDRKRWYETPEETA